MLKRGDITHKLPYFPRIFTTSPASHVFTLADDILPGMDRHARERFRQATKPLLCEDDWAEIERLWNPFVKSGDVDAQGELAQRDLGALYATPPPIASSS